MQPFLRVFFLFFKLWALYFKTLNYLLYLEYFIIDSTVMTFQLYNIIQNILYIGRGLVRFSRVP